MPKKNPWWKGKEMSAEEREDLLNKNEETAQYNEANYGGCCQSVLSALQQYLKLGDGESFKAASALAGGFANCGEIYGEVTGPAARIAAEIILEPRESFVGEIAAYLAGR